MSKARLHRLQKKARRRVARRKRQYAKWRATGKRGHLKAFRRHQKAVRYLRHLIIQATTVQWISGAGVEFISAFEGFPNQGRPYNDPVGYATVGFGRLLGYRPVRPSDHQAIWLPGQTTPGRLTKPEAKRLLRQDLRAKYEPPVRRLFKKGGPLYGMWTQWRYDALVSFAFNLGPGAVTPGTAGFETVGAAINRGDLNAIANAFLLYDKAGGQALPGLTRRRRAERRLFLTGDYSTN